MENTPIIDVHGLSCKSGNNYLLHDVNWKVYPGEHWVVFGLNGSGKTTLLGAVAGFQPYTHGTLRVFGEEYSDENIFRLRRRIGFVSSSFFDKVVAEEAVINIVLSGLFGSLGVRGKVSDRARVEAEMLLATFGLEEKIDYPFKMLSKGERQNVFIARARCSCVRTFSSSMSRELAWTFLPARRPFTWCSSLPAKQAPPSFTSPIIQKSCDQNSINV